LNTGSTGSSSSIGSNAGKGDNSTEPATGSNSISASSINRDGGGTGGTIFLISGPNLDLLGTREPTIYGTATLDMHVEAAAEEARRLGYSIEHFQSNHEGEIVDFIHSASGRAVAIIANLGALTHYSWSIRDALAAYNGIIVEVHLSNPVAREGFRHVSVLADIADGSIAGFGGIGYTLAVKAVRALL
jgi:3-dehydroquinate dehydratase-2